MRKRCSAGRTTSAPDVVRRAPDARALEAAVRARCTSRRRRRPSSRPRRNASLTTARDDVGVRVRGVDGHAVPADVGLDDHDVAAGDELLHPAQRVDRAADEVFRLGLLVVDDLAARDGQLRELGVGLFLQAVVADLRVSAGLLYAEAALIADGIADPGGGAEHADCAAEAKERFAPAQRSRGGLLGVTAHDDSIPPSPRGRQLSAGVRRFS